MPTWRGGAGMRRTLARSDRYSHPTPGRFRSLALSYRTSGRFGLQTGREREARHHVVAGDGADQLHHLLVREDRPDPAHGGRLDVEVAGHLPGERQGRPLRLVEVLAVGERSARVPERGQLLLGPPGLEELPLVLEPLVLGMIENADGHDG